MRFGDWMLQGHSRSRFGAAEGDGEEAASAGAGEAMLDVEGNVDVQSAINARLEVTPQVKRERSVSYRLPVFMP